MSPFVVASVIAFCLLGGLLCAAAFALGYWRGARRTAGLLNDPHFAELRKSVEGVLRRDAS